MAQNDDDWLYDESDDLEDTNNHMHERRIHFASLSKEEEKHFNIGYKQGFEDGVESFNVVNDDVDNIIPASHDHVVTPSSPLVQRAFNLGYELSCIIGSNLGTLMAYKDFSDRHNMNIAEADTRHGILEKWSSLASKNIMDFITVTTIPNESINVKDSLPMPQLDVNNLYISLVDDMKLLSLPIIPIQELFLDPN